MGDIFDFLFFNKLLVKFSGIFIFLKLSYFFVQNFYLEDIVMIFGNLSDVDSLGKDDDDNQYCEEIEYDDCIVGFELDNIILGEFILYIGDLSLFRYWFFVVYMDGCFREFFGCYLDVDEKRVICFILIMYV